MLHSSENINAVCINPLTLKELLTRQYCDKHAIFRVEIHTFHVHNSEKKNNVTIPIQL